MNKNRTDFVNNDIASNKRSFSYVMPKKRSVDIDDINDFENVRYLISKQLKNK
jgi:CMP-N-acetylneuraminic acid synthetase